MTQAVKRSAGVYGLMALLVFQGLSGIAGGIGLVSDPTGASMQIPIEWLEGSPFTDYRIPGIILLLVLGVFPLGVFAGLLKRWKISWSAAVLTGIALLIWIGVEILVIGYQPQPPLQAVYGTVGLLILILAGLPSVRHYFENHR